MFLWILSLLIAIMVPPFLVARDRRFHLPVEPVEPVLPVLPGHRLPPRRCIPTRPHPRQTDPSSSEQPPPEEPQEEEPRVEQFHPSPGDINVVREMLCQWTTIPVEVVNGILNFAEYWAHSSNEIDYKLEDRDTLRISGTSPNKDRFLLRSYPIGLTHIDGTKHLAEELAYDTTGARPLPLTTAHDAAYFHRLVNYQTPVLEAPVRKVVFTIISHDQGWGGSRDDGGTYRGSYTWFEAGLEKFDATQACDPQCVLDVRHRSAETVAPTLPVCALRPIQPPIEVINQAENKYKYSHSLEGEPHAVIQRNLTATKIFKEHVVTWSWLDDISPDSTEAESLALQGRGPATGDGSFVRNLRIGDVITVWGKARFPGWMNYVDKVKIDVYWMV